MKKLNNKGYMLVEIILAFGIMMTLLYFITELTIKQKNKNDDLLVKTLVSTDQTIIYNTIMDDLNKVDSISCDDIKSKISIDKEKNIITYDGKTNVISEYVTLDDLKCNDNKGSFIDLNIPINVKQLPNDSFDINIKKKSSTLPEVQIELSSDKISPGNHTFIVNDGNLPYTPRVGYRQWNHQSENYVARYTFTTTKEQYGNSVKILINPVEHTSGSGKNLRFYIGTSETSHRNAGYYSDYTGSLTKTSINPIYTGYEYYDFTFQLSGIGNVEIKPNTTYYLWVFSSLKDSETKCTPGAEWQWVECSEKFLFDLGEIRAWVSIILNPRQN